MSYRVYMCYLNIHCTHCGYHSKAVFILFITCWGAATVWKQPINESSIWSSGYGSKSFHYSSALGVALWTFTPLHVKNYSVPHQSCTFILCLTGFTTSLLLHELILNIFCFSWVPLFLPPLSLPPLSLPPSLPPSIPPSLHLSLSPSPVISTIPALLVHLLHQLYLLPNNKQNSIPKESHGNHMFAPTTVIVKLFKEIACSNASCAELLCDVSAVCTSVPVSVSLVLLTCWHGYKCNAAVFLVHILCLVLCNASQ